jgi:Leucine-rich repeat (LRR) protein
LQLFITLSNVFSEPACNWNTFDKNRTSLFINRCKATAIDVEFLGSQNGTGEINNVLKYLAVFQIGLTVVEDYTFSTASEMETLMLSSNEISVIKGKAFSGLKSLERLSLRNNKITTLEIETFNELFELAKLDLSYNNLRSFDFAILHRNMKLNSFYLRNNSLVDFKNSQDSLELNIQELIFANNFMTAFHLNNLPNLPNLKSLSINSNNLTDIEFDKIAVKFPNLSWFNFGLNQWDCCYLIKMIEKLKEMLPKIDIDYEYSGNLQDAQFEHKTMSMKCPDTTENRIKIIKLENDLNELKTLAHTQFEQVSKCIGCPEDAENRNKIIKLENDLNELKTFVKTLIKLMGSNQK